MERCPCCNARLKDAVKCPRCQANLSDIIGSERSAKFWLSRAIQFWAESKTEQSLAALDISIGLKKIKLAIAFRNFLIQKQYRDIMDLLAQKQLLAAKQQLYRVRLLYAHSMQLQQLNRFTDYLLAKKQEQFDIRLNLSALD